MRIACPNCKTPVEADQVNVARDVAHCVPCNEIFSLSALLRESEDEAILDPNTPPPRGTWYLPTFDGFTLGATTRSGVAFFFIPFTCLWGGVSLAGIYGSQIYSGRFDLEQSLFGLPFLIGTCVLVPLCLLFSVGRSTLTVRGDEGRTFLGVGPIGIRRRFDWSAVTGVTMSEFGQVNRKPAYRIELEGPKPVKFAAMVAERRKAYLLAMTRKLLRERRYQPAGTRR